MVDESMVHCHPMGNAWCASTNSADNLRMTALDPRIMEYYQRGLESNRLLGGFPSGPLEFERTKEIVSGYLTAPPLRVIDVGGGPGVYASWLVDRGNDVYLVDPVSLHVDQARSLNARIHAEVGDARQLD